MTSNPFTPTFGVSPPLLVGREDEVGAFLDAMDDGPGSPGRAVLFTGTRGSGKTVMLNAVEDVARTRGWFVLSETTRDGVARDLAHTSIPALLREHSSNATQSHLTAVAVNAAGFGGGLTRERLERHQPAVSLRSQLEALTTLAESRGTGVLISLDEVHGSAITDLRVVAQAVQHAFREGRDVAFAGAGLPYAVNNLLNDGVLTFLRRAERFAIGAVPVDDVTRALHEPITTAGRDITPPALVLAATAAHGYPFMVQLIGHQVWNVDRASPVITLDQAEIGVTRAVRRVGTLVHEAALADLSTVDQAFLTAMAEDDQPSRMSTIAARLGVDANYASQYRLRLLAAELITPAGYGHVTFTLPYLREYLRGQPDIPTPGHPTPPPKSPHPALDRLRRFGHDPRNQWPGPPTPNQAPPR